MDETCKGGREEISNEPPADGSRVHSTVNLCQFTLEFESKSLEDRYRQYSRVRWRRLFLRSLPPSVLFQLLFLATDYTFFPLEYMWISGPARLFLVALQLCLFILAHLDLLAPRQRIILASTLIYGLTSLTIFGLQRPELGHLDGLYVVFGLAFYAVPKVSPLSFLASFTGSWITVVWYGVMATLVRPPPNVWHAVLGLFYIIPVVVVFNTVMYHYECSARERFVLRDRLRQERITIAVARTGPKDPQNRTASPVLLGALLWFLLSAAGWASIHETLQSQLRVDSDTAWAWFSHCAGLSVFMLIVTRQTRWIFVFPIFGAFVLWGMTRTVPERWILLSAHWVGYSLLALTAVAALGVFGQFMAAWQQLVAFLRRTCLLYPQLRAGLTNDFPLLDPFVRDYIGALTRKGSKAKECIEKPMVKEQETDEHESALRSVLLTPKPDMCFFCGNNGAVHFVPCCSAWGPYAQWRLELSLGAERATAGAKAEVAPPVAMCTPYTALQLKLKQTEVDLQLEQWERRRAEQRWGQSKAHAAQASSALQETRAEAARQIQALQQQIAALNHQWNSRLESMSADYNRALHDSHEAMKVMERQLHPAPGAPPQS